MTCVCRREIGDFRAACRAPRAACCRAATRDSRDTSLSGSFRSPKTSACAGHACTQAGLISPSSSSRSSALAWICRRLDALHAERALLHHADFAHRHVGIELQVERLVPRRVEEVEEPDVVRAGVGAVARADAAVVDLRVQAVLGVMAGVGRAHRLARRVVALLAHHRPELQPHVRELALPVALDANPVLGAAARRLRRRRRSRCCSRHGRPSRTRRSRCSDRGRPPFPTSACTSRSVPAPVASESVLAPRASPRSARRMLSHPPANRISRPSGSPTRAIVTRVAAQASAPVVGSVDRRQERRPGSRRGRSRSA